jgi:histone-lysine N-methyltransferase SETMAR
VHDNALAHYLGVVFEFLVKQGITMLSHPPYSPNLAPAGFLLFPKLKIAMKGMRFKAASSIQQTVTRKLKVIWEGAFSHALNLLYE